jgi:hypothetical protein
MVRAPGKASERSIKISKGLIFSFFTVYLIFYGITLTMFIDHTTLENPGMLSSFLFITYIPLFCYVGALFMGLRLLIFIKSSNEQRSRQKKSVKRKGKSSIYKQALFLLVFIFVFIPLLSPLIDQGKNDQNFSIYNEDWNGASDFRKYLLDEGYEVGAVQSSLSATERLNKSVLLVLLGPNSFYNPLFEIPFFVNFFKSGQNSLLLCHDHGSTSTLLYEIAIASLLDPTMAGKIPITIFPDGILLDNESAAPDPDNPVKKNPAFPIINFSSPTNQLVNHTTSQGITNVILSRSTAAAGGPFVDFSGWEVVGYSSLYSFIDKNDDRMYTFEEDSIDLSAIGAALGSDFGSLLKLPLGGYPQAVFMAKDTGSGRVFVSADASLFNNELIREPGYDNLQFALNIINWLTYDQKDNWVVVFDEAHIRPEYSRDLTSAGIFGFIMQYIVHLSTNPITAWIYPLLAIYTFRKYVPKKDDEKEQKKKIEKEEKKEEVARFRTSSFFANKIEWYREKHKYHKALTLLYRRLERKLNAQLAGASITTDNVLELARVKEGRLSKQKEKKLTSFMDKILSIKKGKTKIKSHEEFEKLFYKMEWASSIL